MPPADPAAFALFGGQLGAGSTRIAIAQQVLTSSEARLRRISALYMKYLHRPASRGPAYDGEDQMAASILGSEEYCLR